MIIQDLDYLAIDSNLEKIEGSLANLTFNLEFLSLGSLISMANVTQAEFLTTESPTAVVASGKFSLNMLAGGTLALAVGF